MEVFASAGARACRERELVLRAQAIPYWRERRGGAHVLLVERRQADAALAELRSYEQENRGWPPRDTPPPRAPGAFQGLAVFLALVVLFHFFAVGDAFGLHWYALGAARADALLGAEPWRAVTSLFLHVGPVHLVSNLLFGALFGFLVLYTHGGGLGLLAILVAGTLGNVTNAWIQDPTHLSVGASTAVFGAVGCLAGSEWRRRNLLRQRRLRRAAPVVMALCILGYYGASPDPDVDVLAHVTGLAWGLPIGALLPTLLGHGALRLRNQLFCGAAALGLVLGSWAAAIAASG